MNCPDESGPQVTCRETFEICARKLSQGPTDDLAGQATEGVSAEQHDQKCVFRYSWWQNTR